MKQLLFVAALALGLSVTGAFAQRAVNIADTVQQVTVNPVDENLLQVHKKHKKYKKRFAKRHYNKHHRYYAYKHRPRHYRHYTHRHERYYGPAYGLYGSIILGNGAVIIRLY